jgi:hypothetical protein
MLRCGREVPMDEKLDIQPEDDIDLEVSESDVDEDWRRAELEKLMFGEDEGSSKGGKIFLLIIVVVVLGGVGWIAFGPAAPKSEPTPTRAATPAPEDVAPPVPRTPPPPPPPPRPHRDLFEVQTQFDGTQTIVYTIQPGDDLFAIGEKLHDVTGAPRVVTHQAVEDAYWRKFFSYEEQNIEIVTPAMVQEKVGEFIQIPVPLPEFPEYDLASEITSYNES